MKGLTLKGEDVIGYQRFEGGLLKMAGGNLEGFDACPHCKPPRHTVQRPSFKAHLPIRGVNLTQKVS